ncbi:MAG: hypothetical protein ACRYGO_05260 [Janthinobacterium lividum]
MRRPTFRYLARLAQESPAIVFASGSPSLSGHPKLYKYFWQVFSVECPWENDEFFELAPHLCTADMVRTTERLLAAGHSAVLYGWKRPRKASGAPWDLAHPRWKDAVFAPSWDDDTDEVSLEGHK